jgi:hypothetical protein
VQQRVACGERAGQTVRRIGLSFGYAGEHPTRTGPRCASVHGYSLHAHTQVSAHRRDQWKRLIRYTARGAVALERLADDAHGDRVYAITKPWSDGTTGITLASLERMEKLAALVPLPRVHPVRYGAVWRRTVCCVARSRQRHASRAWESLRSAAPRRAGAGRGSSSGCLPLTWQPVRCAIRERCGSSRPSRRESASKTSAGL